MKEYKRIVHYKEFYSDEPLKLHEGVNFSYSEQDKKLLITYLLKGSRILAIMQALWDMIDDDTFISGYGMFSDDVWEWRSDVLYYIERYNLKVADEFFDYVKSQSIQP